MALNIKVIEPKLDGVEEELDLLWSAGLLWCKEYDEDWWEHVPIWLSDSPSEYFARIKAEEVPPEDWGTFGVNLED